MKGYQCTIGNGIFTMDIPDVTYEELEFIQEFIGIAMRNETRKAKELDGTLAKERHQLALQWFPEDAA